jgi:hypothetical protein
MSSKTVETVVAFIDEHNLETDIYHRILKGDLVSTAIKDAIDNYIDCSKEISLIYLPIRTDYSFNHWINDIYFGRSSYIDVNEIEFRTWYKNITGYEFDNKPECNQFTEWIEFNQSDYNTVKKSINELDIRFFIKCNVIKIYKEYLYLAPCKYILLKIHAINGLYDYNIVWNIPNNEYENNVINYYKLRIDNKPEHNYRDFEEYYLVFTKHGLVLDKDSVVNNSFNFFKAESDALKVYYKDPMAFMVYPYDVLFDE